MKHTAINLNMGDLRAMFNSIRAEKGMETLSDDCNPFQDRKLQQWGNRHNVEATRFGVTLCYSGQDPALAQFEGDSILSILSTWTPTVKVGDELWKFQDVENARRAFIALTWRVRHGHIRSLGDIHRVVGRYQRLDDEEDS